MNRVDLGGTVGTTKRREREREALRLQILDAARYLFARDGYDAVTMRAIAERIEYSPRTIYLHFQDKEDLIRELCRHDFKAFGADMANSGQVKDPIQRIKAIGLAYARFGAENPNHYRLMFMSSAPDYEGMGEEDWKGNPEVDAYAFLLGTVQEALATGRLKRGLKDAELIAQTLWAGVHGVISLDIAKCNDPWVKWRVRSKRIKTMVDVLVDGLLEPTYEGHKHG